MKDSGEWCTAIIRVDDARMGNRQNDGTDFRLFQVQNDRFAIRRLKLRPCHSDVQTGDHPAEIRGTINPSATK